MNIAIVGTGYVGLVTGTCFAEMGNNVYCVDINEQKITDLKNGHIPIYEPGLDKLVRVNYLKQRLHFLTDLKECIGKVEVVFSAVGTPPDEDGSADLKYVLDVAKTFGETITEYKVIVTKSTVPVGTAEKVRQTVQEALNKRGVNIPFDVVSNPEFLKEGKAVEDFLRPERIVVGVDNERSKKVMEKLYKPFTLNGNNLIFTSIPSAEMIKYAANAMLATRISFMNDIANLCDKVGANIEDVRKGIGTDSRIGSKFLYAGCGYGGSCFPKDVQALIKTGEKEGHPLLILKAVEQVNERQKYIPFQKLIDHYHEELKGKTIGLFGVSFKPDTDDMREAPSLYLMDALHACDCKIRVCDPIALEECRRRVGDKVTYCHSLYETAKDCDAVILVTEWKEYRMVDWERLRKTMKGNVIVDGRNIYNRQEVEYNGLIYYGIGK